MSKVVGVTVVVECDCMKEPPETRTSWCTGCNNQRTYMQRISLQEFASLFAYGETHIHRTDGVSEAPIRMLRVQWDKRVVNLPDGLELETPI